MKNLCIALIFLEHGWLAFSEEAHYDDVIPAHEGKDAEGWHGIPHALIVVPGTVKS